MNSTLPQHKLSQPRACRSYTEVYPDISQHPLVITLAAAAYSTVFLLSLLGNTGEFSCSSPLSSLRDPLDKILTGKGVQRLE